MNHKIFLPTLLLFLLGIFFVGAGITGMIISETCCFPPNCLEENLCDIAKNPEKVPQNDPSNVFLTVGAFLMITGSVIYAETHHLYNN